MPPLVDPNRTYTGKAAAAPTPAGSSGITYTIAKGSKPAAPTVAAGAGGGSGSLYDVASGRSWQDTNALVAGLVAQQQAAYQQAALRAAQQGQLGLATSKYLEGLHLGDATTHDYAAAAAAERAAAAGYSGGLQQTVSDAAAEVQRNLAATGSQQTAPNQGAAAGNVLYGLGGNLPALQLDAIGPTIAAGMRALPAQTLGYGQQLAMGELSSGQQEAAKLTPDIVAALAKQPGLTSSYLDALTKAAQDAQTAAETAAYHRDSLNSLNAYRSATIEQRDAALSRPVIRSAGGGLYAFDPTTGRTTTIKAPPVKETLPTFRQFGDTLYQVTPDGLTPVAQQPAKPNLHYGANGEILQLLPDGTFKQLRAPTPTPRPTKVISDPTGQWLIDSQTGATIAKVGDATGTAAPQLDPTRSAALGIYVDQYGNSWFKTPQIYPGWHVGKNGQPVKDVKPAPAPTVHGNRQWDPVTKRWVPAPGLPATGSGGTGYPNLTKTQVTDLRSGIVNAHDGVPEQRDVNGKVTRAALPPVDYWTAIAHAMQAGYTRADAIKMANSIYGKPTGRGIGSGIGDIGSSILGGVGAFAGAVRNAAG